MSHGAVPFYVVPLPRFVARYRVLPYRAVPCRVASCGAVPCRTMRCRVVASRPVPCCTCRTVPFGQTVGQGRRLRLPDGCVVATVDVARRRPPAGERVWPSARPPYTRVMWNTYTCQARTHDAETCVHDAASEVFSSGDRSARRPVVLRANTDRTPRSGTM